MPTEWRRRRRTAARSGTEAASYGVDMASADAVAGLPPRSRVSLGPWTCWSITRACGRGTVCRTRPRTGVGFSASMCRAAAAHAGSLPAAIARGSGHIVVVASLAGLIGAPGMVAYSTTKFALVGSAKSLRLELVGSRRRHVP